MIILAELPIEILVAIAYADKVAEEWESVPPRHYARKVQDEQRLVVNLSQVNRRLRQIFLPGVWRKVDLYHVVDVYLVDAFLHRTHYGHVYGPLIEHLVFSWGDSVHADGLRGEVHMDEHNQDHGLFGRKQDWLFQDRKELLMRTELAEDHHNYPDMTMEEFFDFQWNWTEEYQEYRITTGPDGWGDVPGFSSPDDVAEALTRISSFACNVTRLDYNERYIPIPPFFLANFNRLKSVTLYSDNNHQDTRDSALEELPLTLQHMDIKYLFNAEAGRRTGNRRRPAPFLSPDSTQGRLGVAYKELQDGVDEPERRLRKLCAAILRGFEHGSLQSILLMDHELLHVAEMLPCWCALDLQRNKQGDLGQEGWALDVRVVLVMGGQRSDCMLDAIATFKADLKGSVSAEQVRDWCRQQVSRCRQQVSKSSEDDTFDVNTLAGWIADDEALCHAVARGLNYRSKS